jgi:hypothetical protein
LPESFGLSFKYLSVLSEGDEHKDNLEGTTVKIKVTSVNVDNQEKV